MNWSKLAVYITGGIALGFILGLISYPVIKSKLNERALNSNKRIIENALEFYRADFEVYPKRLDYLVGSKSKVILNKVPINLSEWDYSLNDGSYSLNSKL